MSETGVIGLRLDGQPLSDRERKIPLAIKVIYSVFVVVLVPYYWLAYGPQNFLFFCDVALLVTLAALWMESSLLTSLEAVAILLPQTLWVVDFLLHFAGIHLLGMTNYMFDPKYSLFVRGLSTFHGWLPFLLVFMLIRLGYDRRAFAIQCAIGIAMLVVSYFCFAPPPAPAAHPNWAVNINYVYGMSDDKPQVWMPPLAWLGMLVVAFPIVLYLPVHLILSKVFGGKEPVSPDLDHA